MAKSVEILRDNLREHPAARSWNALNRTQVAPAMIAVIKPWKGSFKSAVYRLAGVGPGGSAVIAKRCPLQTADVERPIYEEFLPRLPVPSIGYYGSVEEPDGQSCWLFLEEASGEFYSPQNQEHRVLAARWLAAVHNAGRRDGWKTRLPDRSPAQYLQLLRSCRTKVREHVVNPALPSESVAVLEAVSEQCDVLEAGWSELEEICQTIPRTLIHGDFVIKNLRVRPSAGGPVLLAFDWEFAGWGAPGTDLVQFTGRVASPDLAVYRSHLEGWPTIGDDSQIQRLAECGRFFRVVDAMYWTCVGLVAGPPKLLITPISELKVYSQRMALALSEAGWTTHD